MIEDARNVQRRSAQRIHLREIVIKFAPPLAQIKGKCTLIVGCAEVVERCPVFRALEQIGA